MMARIDFKSPMPSKWLGLFYGKNCIVYLTISNISLKFFPNEPPIACPSKGKLVKYLALSSLYCLLIPPCITEYKP